jgi:hypothetical protein
MSGHSSIDSLRRLSAASDSDAAAVFGTAGHEELLADLTRLPFGRGTRRRPVPRRRRLVLVLAVFVLAATATAATWAVLGTGPARETTSVECVIDGADTVIPSTSGDPVQDCDAEWMRELGSAAPALVAYDNKLGGVTVLPRSQKPPQGWTVIQAQSVALIELQHALDDYVDGLNSSCLDANAATALAKTKLSEFGFRDWTVAVRSGSGSCVAADVVDPSSQTVTLIPTGAQTGSEAALFRKLADKLRPIAHGCERLPAAVAAANAAATSLGLSASAKTYELNSVVDDSLRCASIYETVGGTIFLTVRGPGG